MIPAQAFVRQLNQQQARVYPIVLVHGEEPFYALQALQGYRAFLQQQGYSERERFEVDPRFRWQDLQLETQAGSLFAQQRIIELEMPKGNPGKDGAAFIQNWVQQPIFDLPEICLLIRCDKLEIRQIKSKWVQAIESGGLVIQSNPMEARALPQWCQQQAQLKGLGLTSEAAHALAERVEGNLLAADQELMKLALYFPVGTQLDEAAIIENVVDQAHYQLFALSSAVLLGRVDYSLQILLRLQQEAFEAPIILWLLAKDIRQLLTLAQKQQQMPLNQAFAQLKVWKSKQTEYRAALTRHEPQAWQGFLQAALAIDLAIKGIQKKDPWLGLQQLVFQLASGPGQNLR